VLLGEIACEIGRIADPAHASRHGRLDLVDHQHVQGIEDARGHFDRRREIEDGARALGRGTLDQGEGLVRADLVLAEQGHLRRQRPVIDLVGGGI
jgi:hypothetical protein